MWCGTVWCGLVWCGVVWCGVVRRGAARRGAARCRQHFTDMYGDPTWKQVVYNSAYGVARRSVAGCVLRRSFIFHTIETPVSTVSKGCRIRIRGLDKLKESH